MSVNNRKANNFIDNTEYQKYKAKNIKNKVMFNNELYILFIDNRNKDILGTFNKRKSTLDRVMVLGDNQIDRGIKSYIGIIENKLNYCMMRTNDDDEGHDAFYESYIIDIDGKMLIENINIQNDDEVDNEHNGGIMDYIANMVDYWCLSMLDGFEVHIERIDRIFAHIPEDTKEGETMHLDTELTQTIRNRLREEYPDIFDLRRRDIIHILGVFGMRFPYSDMWKYLKANVDAGEKIKIYHLSDTIKVVVHAKGFCFYNPTYRTNTIIKIVRNLSNTSHLDIDDIVLLWDVNKIVFITEDRKHIYIYNIQSNLEHAMIGLTQEQSILNQELEQKWLNESRIWRKVNAYLQ